MTSIAAKLRADAERIWRAGVAAVLPGRLVPENVQIDGKWLVVGDDILDLDSIGRIVVVGAGKAAGAMTVALENALGPQLLDEKQVSGWVNVPADCVVPTQRVHVHAARAASVNEPSTAGVEGTRHILEIVSTLGADDVCFCMLTGGGSALLPAPVPEISLEEKVRVTRLLSGAGANIEQLNVVRQNLSLVKGGGLARACHAGQLIALIISDVLGDPLDLIASGPTVQRKSIPADALSVLEAFELTREPSIVRIVNFLRVRSQESVQQADRESFGGTSVTNFLIGNNATAVDAAGAEAEKLGYSHAMIAATKSEGAAEEVGQHLAKMALHMRDNAGPDCLISGGEPTVKLVDEHVRGKGGRNQQLVLAALAVLGDCRGICLLSGGTDGEDGPTNAAGAFVNEEVIQTAAAAQLKVSDYLNRNDAYNFFERCGGLLITGPTQTNVCDIRVAVVRRPN